MPAHHSRNGVLDDAVDSWKRCKESNIAVRGLKHGLLSSNSEQKVSRQGALNFSFVGVWHEIQGFGAFSLQPKRRA